MSGDSTGRSIADALAATIEGDRVLGVSIVAEPADASPGVAETSDRPSVGGEFAYAIAADETRLAEVYVHPDRVRIEVGVAPGVAAAAGERAGLRVRPKAVRPPKTLLFVESREEVAAALDAIEAVCDAAL